MRGNKDKEIIRLDAVIVDMIQLAACWTSSIPVEIGLVIM